MWDYGCWPLWLHDGQIFDNIDPATLPLSLPTRTRLEAWAAIPNTKLAEVKYPPDMKWTIEEENTFEAEGIKLWEILRNELGQNFYVMYQSKAEGWVLLPTDKLLT